MAFVKSLNNGTTIGENEMDHNIACCYLTHNHANVVREVLDIVKDIYDRNGIDIYIYDSSSNMDTKEIVDELVKKGTNNLFYVRVDEKIGGGGKLLEIFKGVGLKKEYDYIWANKDRSYVLESAVEIIQSESHKGFECMYIDSSRPMQMARKKYKTVYNREEFFYEFGWIVTSWETILLHTQKMLKLIDWEAFEKKYRIGPKNSFNQVLVVFGQLATISNPKIRVFERKDVPIYNSPTAGSGWIDYTFELWGQEWPEAIRSLPECYDEYKAKVIMDQGMHPCVFGSINWLVYLKKRGILNEKTWGKVKKTWSDVSEISSLCMEAILADDYDRMIKQSFADFNDALKEEKYDKAYYLFTENSFLEYTLGTVNYWMLRYSFDVYLQEIFANKEPGIMKNVHDYEDILYKYQFLKYYVRRLEYGINSEKIADFIKNNGISSEFLGSVIERECMEPIEVIEKLEQIYSTGE